MLGHELRNPLSSIRTAAELLKLNGSEDPEIRRTQEILERQSTHMAKLLDGLLDVSRIINGKIQLELDSVDLVDVCREVLEDSRERAAENGLSLDETLPGNATGRQGRSRPARAGGRQPALERAALQPSEAARSGSRWPPRTTRRRSASPTTVGGHRGGPATACLRRVSASRARASIGPKADSASGSPLVRSLVELHGGRVEARSEGAGRGSEFVMRLPLSERATPSRHPVSRSPRATTSTSSSSRTTPMPRTSSYGCSSASATGSRRPRTDATASNGRSDCARTWCFCGPRVARRGDRLRRREGRSASDPRPGATRLVALSGYGRPEDKARSTESGFDDHLTKPVGVAELRRALAGAGPDATD